MGNCIRSSTSNQDCRFDAAGIPFNAWLANLPQIFLSALYFSVNRLCTSLYFAYEWNKYATRRKGLRVTSPKGDQRSTYFLQLPFRYAIPLVAISGLMHWLLSQSIFLVRFEHRNEKASCPMTPPALADILLFPS